MRVARVRVRVRVARRWQTYFWLLTPLEKRHLRSCVIVDSALAVTAAHTISTSSWKHEKGAQIPNASSCMRTVSARVRSLICSPACHHACRALAGYPTLIVTFFDYESRTTRQAAGKLAERLRRVRTLGPCGQGGASAREAAQECLGARL